MLRRNLITNLAGRGASLLIQAILIPFYLHVLGIEAVGLIGFYNTLVTVLGVVEYAMGTMIMREMAVLSETHDGAQLQRNLLRATEAFYILLLLAIGVGVSFAAPIIVRIWLSRSNVGDVVLARCVGLMGWTVALQLFGSLYLNVLNGLERQSLSNVLTIALAGARGCSALFVLLALSTTIEAYFVSQLVATALVLVASATVSWRSLPRAPCSAQLSINVLLSTWRRSRSLTGAAILFVVLSQADKFIASSILPLRDFGCYVIASMIASLMFSIYGSVGNALVPRFARLIVLRSDEQIAQLFHVASQLVCFMLVPVATMVAFFGKPLLLLWISSDAIAGQVAPIATFLTAGILLVCLACASNSLQLAAGFYDLNLLNNVFWISGLPIAYFLTLHYGAIGAAAMWLVSGVANLALAPSILHRRMLKGEQSHWYLYDLGVPACAAIAVGSLSTFLVNPFSSPLLLGLQLAGVWAASSLAMLLIAPDLRRLGISVVRASVGYVFPIDKRAG